MERDKLRRRSVLAGMGTGLLVFGAGVGSVTAQEDDDMDDDLDDEDDEMVDDDVDDEDDEMVDDDVDDEDDDVVDDDVDDEDDDVVDDEDDEIIDDDDDVIDEEDDIDDDGPGFGAVAGIAGLGGAAAYAYKKLRLDAEPTDTDD